MNLSAGATATTLEFPRLFSIRQQSPHPAWIVPGGPIFNASLVNKHGHPASTASDATPRLAGQHTRVDEPEARGGGAGQDALVVRERARLLAVSERAKQTGRAAGQWDRINSQEAKLRTGDRVARLEATGNQRTSPACRREETISRTGQISETSRSAERTVVLTHEGPHHSRGGRQSGRSPC